MATALTGKTTLAKKGAIQQRWFVIDAADQVLGRLASDVATLLMGKHKPIYTPHVDTGDFVIVVNAARIRITGSKLDKEAHDYYTHYPSGRKVVSWRQMLDKHPEKLVELAIRRMLPKTKLGRHMLGKLKIYAGQSHPHQAQQPMSLDLSQGLSAGLQKLTSQGS